MYETYPNEDSWFARIEFAVDISLRLCTFSSKASSRASRRSAFCVLDGPFEMFKDVLAIPILYDSLFQEVCVAAQYKRKISDRGPRTRTADRVEKGTRGLFLESPNNFSGPKSYSSNCNLLRLKSLSFNMFLM